MKIPHRIFITPGEPAGIGPDVTLQIAQFAWPDELIAIADMDLLNSRAKILGLKIECVDCDLNKTPEPHQAGKLKVLPIKLHSPAIPGELNPLNSSYTLETLKLATDLCLQKIGAAIVTGPVNKEVINASGIPFSGHTEFFATTCRVKRTVMLFVIDQMKVALATTHLPLANVTAAITTESLRITLDILRTGLIKQFKIENPAIGVCGLNPHAGEGGYLGREEIDVITPLLNTLRAEGFKLEGPLPADTIFTSQYFGRFDAILAMYHDQALPLIKYLGFDRAVNVTFGLPFIRTSVDHGTAINIAGTGQANAGSMQAAIKLASEMIA